MNLILKIIKILYIIKYKYYTNKIYIYYFFIFYHKFLIYFHINTFFFFSIRKKRTYFQIFNLYIFV